MSEAKMKHDLDLMYDVLSDGRWRKGPSIGLMMGCSPRQVAFLANQSNGAIIGGHKGYRLTMKATLEEVNHSVNIALSRGKETIERGLAIRRYYHRPRRQSSGADDQMELGITA